MKKSVDFESIYGLHSVMVYNLALHYLQSVEDAEEITQDVFCQVHNSIDKFKEEASLKTWIYRITVNKCLDFIRRKKSVRNLFVFGQKSGNETQVLNLSTFEHPGILLENKEDAAILFNVINQLPENQKTAFILSKIDGLSNPEIGEVMHLSISSVESLVFRAKVNLREKLAVKFPDYHKKK